MKKICPRINAYRSSLSNFVRRLYFSLEYSINTPLNFVSRVANTRSPLLGETLHHNPFMGCTYERGIYPRDQQINLRGHCGSAVKKICPRITAYRSSLSDFVRRLYFSLENPVNTPLNFVSRVANARSPLLGETLHHNPFMGYTYERGIYPRDKPFNLCDHCAPAVKKIMLQSKRCQVPTAVGTLTGFYLFPRLP